MMRLLRHITLSAAIVLAGCSPLLAANSGIGLILLSYSLSNQELGQAKQGYTMTINARLVNYDSLQYVGVVDFGLRNKDRVLSDNRSVFTRPSYGGLPIILEGRETVPAIFNVTLDAQYFKPGPDVVVVWPITPLPFYDSIEIPLTVLENGTLGLASIPEETSLSFNYVLTESKIMLLNLSAETNFKQVRIFDLEGQKVSELKADHIREVPLPAMPQGIYLSEFTAADGRRKVVKFWH